MHLTFETLVFLFYKLVLGRKKKEKNTSETNPVNVVIFLKMSFCLISWISTHESFKLRIRKREKNIPQIIVFHILRFFHALFGNAIALYITVYQIKLYLFRNK